MAALKESIVQRASDAVVLNADNDWSVGMLPRLGGRKAWLVAAVRPPAGGNPGLAEAGVRCERSRRRQYSRNSGVGGGIG